MLRHRDGHLVLNPPDSTKGATKAIHQQAKGEPTTAVKLDVTR
jgi:hypothetical protein